MQHSKDEAAGLIVKRTEPGHKEVHCHVVELDAPPAELGTGRADSELP